MFGPIKTLIGANSLQTIINNERLKNLLKAYYDNDKHYRIIDLYDDGQNITYYMNWVLSDMQLNAMNTSLDYNKELKKLVEEINK